MNHFVARDHDLFCEDVSLRDIATKYGTPAYVYSAATLRRHAHVLKASLGADSLVCFAVKANSNLGVLSLLAKEDLGFDIVSHGELERVLLAGGRADRVVFSGVGKTIPELERAMQVGVRQFNVESGGELLVLNEVASRLKLRARVGLRVNPEVDAKTHPYIATGLKVSKFGVTFEEARKLYQEAKAMPALQMCAVTCHIGSQITSLEPFEEALDKVLGLIAELRASGTAIDTLDFGGGLGVRYSNESPPDPAALGALVTRKTQALGLRVIIEPGRVLVANAGVLLCKVLYIKESAHKRFVVIDAAMNDLLRPALYAAHHEIEPLEVRDGERMTCDVVGPVCESGDFLAKDRSLPPLLPGDLLVVRGAGAYGFSMSSQYNSRPRVCELLVSGARTQIVRAREQLEDLWRGEQTLNADM